MCDTSDSCKEISSLLAHKSLNEGESWSSCYSHGYGCLLIVDLLCWAQSNEMTLDPLQEVGVEAQSQPASCFLMTAGLQNGLQVGINNLFQMLQPNREGGCPASCRATRTRVMPTNTASEKSTWSVKNCLKGLNNCGYIFVRQCNLFPLNKEKIRTDSKNVAPHKALNWGHGMNSE